MISAVMPTYGRADIAFERGEGAYLFTADGTRYLDFCAGIAVNALGHAHPRLVEALTGAGREAVAHLQHLPRARPGAPGRAAGGQHLRRHRVLLQFGRRSGRMRHQDRARLFRRGRQARTLSHHLRRERLPRAHARDHRRGRTAQAAQGIRSGGRRLRPCRLRQSERDPRRDHRQDRGDPDRAGPGRGRHPARPGGLPRRPARDRRRIRAAAVLRRGPVRHGPHRQAVRL